MEQITKIISQGPGAVLSLCLIGLLYFVLVRFTRSLDQLGAHMDAVADRVGDAVTVNSLVLLGLQSQLLTHDLTVSGLNPDAGSTVTERDSRALVKYIDVQRNLQMVRDELQAQRTAAAARKA